jgi:hypothetical protein
MKKNMELDERCPAQAMRSRERAPDDETAL